NPTLMEEAPDTYLSMGLTAENLVRRHSISREAQDAFALASHQKALAAIDGGRFEEEIVPVTVQETEVASDSGIRSRAYPQISQIDADEFKKSLSNLRQSAKSADNFGSEVRTREWIFRVDEGPRR